MKLKVLLVVLSVALFVGCSNKFDDSPLWSAIDSLQQRVDALETVMKAYQNKVLIDNVQTTDDGYIITFSDGSKAVIVNDKPLDPSDLPEDKDTCYIEHIEVSDTDVHFFLSDGTDFIIKLVVAIDIVFEDASPVTVIAGQKRTLNFTVESDMPEIEVETISSGDIKSRILAFDNLTQAGQLEVVIGDSVDEYSKVVLIATNGRRVAMKRLSFSNEGLGIFDNSIKEMNSEGGTLDLEFVSSTPTEVVIPKEAQTWVREIPDSRSAERNSVSLYLEPNYGSTRRVDITVRSADGSCFVVFHICQERSVDAVDASEEEALIAIFEAYEIGWDRYAPVNTWFGVTVEDGHVTGLDLDYCRLSNPLPREIGALTHLKTLKLGICAITSLPDEIGLLTELETFEIGGWYNTEPAIKGVMPVCIYQLTNLKRLVFYNHQITSVDSRLANLKNMEYLNLNGNKLTSFDFNALCTLSNLRHFSVRTNYDLNGQIPTEIGNLRNLEYFAVDYCNLSGNVPVSFWTLGKLKDFMLAGNNFNKIKLPESFSNMKDLECIALSEIPLEGSIPSDIGLLKNLRTIVLEQCGLTGEIPASIVNCKNLTDVTLLGNNLTGEIPAGIGDLPLEILNLAYNQLTGSIPTGLGDISILWLSNNKLTGLIPDDLITSDVWRNGFGNIIYENNLDYTFSPFQGPVLLSMFVDTQQKEPYDINTEYAKHKYTILFAMSSRCPYLEEALDMMKKIYDKYTVEQVGIVGRTYDTDSAIKEQLNIPWAIYYSQQLDYPAFVEPTITVFDNKGYVVFSDLIQNRFDLPKFLEDNL